MANCGKKCDGVRDLESEVFKDCEWLLDGLELVQGLVYNQHTPQRALDKLEGLEARVRRMKATVAPYSVDVPRARKGRETLRNTDLPE